ncbi:MAG TPA: L-serine ammonia-lyase [Bacteroidota bacterium]|nr:L-serine ammonia-lyase [Bacteroidota bacterium]
MESIKNIFRIGTGPSSSHTMGPRKAAEQFLQRHPAAAKYRVTLYGSLAATGKGHLTDIAILDVFKTREIALQWEPATVLARHPNGMKFEALNEQSETVDEWTAFSIGGGAVVDETSTQESKNIYPTTSMNDILRYCNKHGRSFWEYVDEFEDDGVWDYLNEVWIVMQDAIRRGLENEGVMPGILNMPRKAATYFVKASSHTESLRKRALLFAYALAVSEENASGGVISTAPTCGSSGVLPAVLYYLKTEHNFSDKKIHHAIATAGLFGNVVKANASIAGAEVGCQGEIGTACAMASAATTQLFGGTVYQIEYSAEMGLEHHLGLTCDPVAGLVQIPCIERNAFAAARALEHNVFAMLSDGRHRISFDKVVETMKRTGKDLPSLYRETSTGGLALFDGQAGE